MSVAIYRLLLGLLPPALRRWQFDMEEVFALQLADAWAEAGLTGAGRVWWCAIAELLTLAVPRALLPVASLAGTGVIFFGLVWALGNSIVLSAICHRLLAKLGG